MIYACVMTQKIRFFWNFIANKIPIKFWWNSVVWFVSPGWGELAGIWAAFGRHMGDIRTHPKASGMQLGSIWEVYGRIWEAYGECHHGLAWIGCASTSCVHWHHIESNPVAEAPLAMLVECRYVVALKATTAFAPQSCDLFTLWEWSHSIYLTLIGRAGMSIRENFRKWEQT